MSDPTLCYCDDPVTPHRVLPEWDCTCDGTCRSDCLCHQSFPPATSLRPFSDLAAPIRADPERRARIEAAKAELLDGQPPGAASGEGGA